MNQFLLFLRSIAVSIAVFLVLAFFAAKFFGGTLFRSRRAWISPRWRSRGRRTS